MDMKSASKWYTRIIGIFFLLVIITLVTSYLEYGFQPETMHKIFHILVGGIILKIGWNNNKVWQPFSITNGLFFSYVAIFGWIFPDFGNLEAFNRTDTILHSIVGLTGIGAWFISRKK